ncbi:LpxL/LpxP family Kdo(2)-lipid IV(A) lauroyl/palmitoleoyl acyltransferase [Motiliproteus sediminis]|uniref:LpxL/LpxP family Kdo(2)-lipid IV(A) lauroyl/palmitoleoyl acyltransferase n=1 Tax=Motiliproteus sediminis TaxID=1468178 RepID=UPI001AEF699F|nr:LpxL/LpxP family Kdo(2)-lipid IV(A) lauroyl/palmitoleoyl acyltransferase [Motiliproteus sediminis]
MRIENPTLRDLLGPRFWLLWLGVGLLRLLIMLPFSAQLALGRMIGRLMYKVAPKRAAVARTNIRHCFRELDSEAQERLVVEHFESLGITLFETALSWWGSERKLQPLLTKLEGLEHLQAVQADNQGAILLCAHFTGLEIGAKLLLPHARFAVVYRRMNNPVQEYLTARGRGGHSDEAIPKDNIKRMVQLLRKGTSIWFAADQSYRRKHSALVNFFGQLAPTATVVSTLARTGKAKVLPFMVARKGSGYELKILPPLEEYPSKDPVADTQRYMDLIELQVRQTPAQYLWVHKRFKGAPGFEY